jgi:hypothetical protein
LVLPIPDSLDPVLATAFNPLGAGIRWGVTVPGTSAGDVVAVLGPGIRGLSAVAAAREEGAGFVMVTGEGFSVSHEFLEGHASLADAVFEQRAGWPICQRPVHLLQRAGLWRGYGGLVSFR